MSTTLSFGPVSVAWPWDYEIVAQPSNVKSSGPWAYTTTQLTNGTAAGNADTLYTAQTTIAASGSTTLNLSSLTSALGTSIAFARLKAFYFENSNLTTSTGLAIGGAGSNPFTGGFFDAGTDTLTLRNGMHLSVGVCQDATGYVVGSGVNLKLANSDGSHTATANIGIAGCSV
jgi:hypothetical protein